MGLGTAVITRAVGHCRNTRRLDVLRLGIAMIFCGSELQVYCPLK